MTSKIGKNKQLFKINPNTNYTDINKSKMLNKIQSKLKDTIEGDKINKDNQKLEIEIEDNNIGHKNENNID